MRKAKEQWFLKIRKPVRGVVVHTNYLYFPTLILRGTCWHRLMMDKNNVWRRNILHILLRYLLYCSNLMEFLSYSILVIFEIIVSRNIVTISLQDSADKRCSRNSLILRSAQLLTIVLWHFYLYTKLTVYHIRKYTFRPFILHIAIIVASELEVCLLHFCYQEMPTVWRQSKQY